MIRINLLPGKRRGLRLPEIGVVTVLVLVVAGLAASYAYYAYRNHVVTGQIQQVNARLAEIRPRVGRTLALKKSVDTLRQEETLLKSLEARQLPWADLLTDLAARTPRDVWITAASATGGTTVTLQGTGMSYNAVARFMENLKASAFYTDVDLQAAQASTTGGVKVVQFGLTVSLRPVQVSAQRGQR